MRVSIGHVRDKTVTDAGRKKEVGPQPDLLCCKVLVSKAGLVLAQPLPATIYS
ncbi:MAG: hypothetical protein K8L91_27755 [Anaerolineae bacterium]|nr:hypothetical protein [Anaerolineae bacterium]